MPHRLADKELSCKGMDTLFNRCALRTLRNIICCNDSHTNARHKMD